jgi:hypothetical protein
MDQEDPSGGMVCIRVPAVMQGQIQELVELATRRPAFSDGAGLAAHEREVYQCTDRLGHAILGQQIQVVVDRAEIQQAGRELGKSMGRRVRDQGRREVTVMTSRGGLIPLRAAYFSRNCDLRRRRRQRGCYPVLVLLGIHGCRRYYTPGLVKHVVLLTTAMGSIDEAKHWLEEAGIPLCAQTIQSMTYEFARRVRVAQKAAAVPLGQEATGRRVVVSVDGGRIRIRKRKRGRKTKKGRTGYHGEWREPKLLMIYVIDQTGRQDHSWCAVIDGVLTPRRDGGDAIFALLKHYLAQLKINEADVIVFLADGAPWIWRRVQALRELFLLREDQVLEVIDFYHAVEHLGKVADLRRRWSKGERKRWITKQRRRLLNGKVDEVLQAIDVLCRGRRSRAIRTELEYFHKNASRMRYRALRRQRLPIGSGAIESAIRRVINLRLKGPGIFWYEENANAMLLLRSYYKSARVEQLMALALAAPLQCAA